MAISLPRSLCSPVGCALVELASPDGPNSLDHIARAVEQGLGDELSVRVFKHRLDAPFVDALTRLGEAVPVGHAERVVEARVARLRGLAALRKIAGVFDANDIDWVVVKGPVLAARMEHPQYRAYNDLDLLVRGSHFGRSLDVLVDHGAEELNQNWSAYVRYKVGESPLSFAGIPIDLHWSLVGLRRWRRTMHVDANDMLDRRVTFELGDGVVVSELDRADSLLHLCVHSALSGATRLDQLRDITVMVSHAPPEWQEFARRARLAGVGQLVSHALDRSAIILGAPVPDKVLSGLGARSLSVRRWVDSRGNPETASLLALPVIAARDRIGARWLARATLVGERLRSKLSPDFSWDFADPNSVLYQNTVAGGESARAEFIALAR